MSRVGERANESPNGPLSGDILDSARNELVVIPGILGGIMSDDMEGLNLKVDLVGKRASGFQQHFSNRLPARQRPMSLRSLGKRIGSIDVDVQRSISNPAE